MTDVANARNPFDAGVIVRKIEIVQIPAISWLAYTAHRQKLVSSPCSDQMYAISLLIFKEKVELIISNAIGREGGK